MSYSGNPAETPLDNVRFLLGDTDITDEMLTDVEIEALLAGTNNEPYGAALAGALALAARYARKVDKSLGDLSISYGQMSKGFRDLAVQLRAQMANRVLRPYAGGISVSDKASDRADSDAVQPYFRTGIHDNLASSVEQE